MMCESLEMIHCLDMGRPRTEKSRLTVRPAGVTRDVCYFQAGFGMNLGSAMEAGQIRWFSPFWNWIRPATVDLFWFFSNLIGPLMVSNLVAARYSRIFSLSRPTLA